MLVWLEINAGSFLMALIHTKPHLRPNKILMGYLVKHCLYRRTTDNRFIRFYERYNFFSRKLPRQQLKKRLFNVSL